jgi:hypothetical protein
MRLHCVSSLTVLAKGSCSLFVEGGFLKPSDRMQGDDVTLPDNSQS